MKHLEHLHLILGVENNFIQTQRFSFPSRLIPREKNLKRRKRKNSSGQRPSPTLSGSFLKYGALHLILVDLEHGLSLNINLIVFLRLFTSQICRFGILDEQLAKHTAYYDCSDDIQL
jgi:hypothetical protein